MTPLRRALLAAWVVLGAALVFAVVTVAAGWSVAVGVLLVIASVGSVAYLIATVGPGRAAQERAFLETYGSVEAARATLDVDALRALRDREGVVPAVRRVRQEYPAIPLARAAEIVRSL